MENIPLGKKTFPEFQGNPEKIYSTVKTRNIPNLCVSILHNKPPERKNRYNPDETLGNKIYVQKKNIPVYQELP